MVFIGILHLFVGRDVRLQRKVDVAHLATVEINCNFCPRRGKASVDRLMQEHGPDMPIPDLLRLMSADCPRAPGRQDPPSRVECICRICNWSDGLNIGFDLAHS